MGSPDCQGVPRWRPINGRSGRFYCDSCWEKYRSNFRKWRLRSEPEKLEGS